MDSSTTDRDNLLYKKYMTYLLGHTTGTTTLGVHAIKTIKKLHPLKTIVTNVLTWIITG